jgi:hypothetical protein
LLSSLRLRSDHAHPLAAADASKQEDTMQDETKREDTGRDDTKERQ